MAKLKQPRIDPEELISASNRERIDGFKLYIKRNQDRLKAKKEALQIDMLHPEQVLLRILDENEGRTRLVTQKAMLEEEIKEIEELLNKYKESLRVVQDEEDIMDFINAPPDGNRLSAFVDLPPLNRWAVLRAISRKGLISKEMVDMANKVANGPMNRENSRHKAEFQKLAIGHKEKFSNMTQLKGIREFNFYIREYTGRDTLRDWVNEVMPGHLRHGRPPKK